MFIATITVTLRPSILDVQGKAVHHSFESLGISAITGIRIGKHIEMTIDCATKEEAERLTSEACRKLLANPVMEDFTFTVRSAG
jgi:phosphoribosylformylglycinamidine synthase